ncbi:MAG: insulinase family protein [Deltaproteobacteria bacterium]|nr:insulinase family protein [Deltaproteobacteria bacterium]
MIVEVRPRAPVAAVWLRFAVGAAYEAPGQEGAAHFVEHMLFKGSRRYGVGEVSRRMDRLGADLNAYTGHEETVLHCIAPPAALGEAIGILGDMAFQSRFDPSEMERERAVILDEIAQSRDDPTRVLAEALAARAWGRHPYGRPVTGTQAAVARLDPEAVVAFHRRWYLPVAATLVVVGDVDPEAVAHAALRGLAGPEGSPPPRPVHSLDAQRRGPVMVRAGETFEEQMVEVAFRTPGHRHADLPALDVLASALGEGPSALLPGGLHRDLGTVHAAWAATEVQVDGGLLVAGLSPAEEDVRPSLAALGKVLRGVVEDGIPAEAFLRARSMILADRAWQGETVEGRAGVLAWFLAWHGDPAAEGRYREAVASLDPGTVRDVARRTLRTDQVTVAILGRGVDVSLTDVAEVLAPVAVPVRGWAGRRRPNRASTAREIQRMLLPGGLRLLVEPDPTAPVTAVQVGMLGGTLVETPATAGHAGAWSDLVAEGTSDLDASTFAALTDALAGSVKGISTLSTSGLQAAFPSEHLLPGLALALRPLVAPRFHPDDVDRVAASLRDALRTRCDDPLEVAWDELHRLLFPHHPWRLPAGGTEGSLAGLDARAVKALHGRLLRSSGVVVGVAGPVDPGRMERVVGGILGALPRKAERVRTHAASPPRIRRSDLTGPWRQAQILIGFPGVAAAHPDHAALDLLSTLLASPGGRLFLALREAEGLSYDLDAENLCGYDTGSFVCSAGVLASRVEEATQRMESVIRELGTRPPDREETDQARAAVLGADLQDLQRMSARASWMVLEECMGLDGRRYRDRLAAVERVTPSDLRTVAARYLDLERGVVVRTLPG